MKTKSTCVRILAVKATTLVPSSAVLALTFLLHLSPFINLLLRG